MAEVKTSRQVTAFYPCGCCVTKIGADRKVLSVGVCERHLERPAVELALVARLVDAIGRMSGPPTLIDTAKMSEQVLDYMREKGVGDEGEAVDGSA